MTRRRRIAVGVCTGLVGVLPRKGDRLDDEERITAEKGVRLVEIPMLPGNEPTPEQVAQWLALIDDEASQPILVHCKHGVVRTGMMVAVYELERSRRRNEEVLQSLPMWGHDQDALYYEHMWKFIREYAPRARAPAESAAR